MKQGFKSFLTNKNISKILIILIVILAVFLRLYKIDYGLPYSFLYDETDIYDDVIRISQNYKFILEKDGFMGLSPTSYVYGMFPTYVLTFSTVLLNKTLSTLSLPLDFDFYFVFMRIVNSLFSLLVILFTTLIYKKVFKDRGGTLLTLLLISINWKVVAHSHHINHDSFLMVLTVGSIYFLLNYFGRLGTRNKYIPLVISSVLFGLAVGTKITALINVPIILLLLVLNKKIKDIFIYLLFIFLGFAISNPFSIINFSEFSSRIILMREVEAGVVFGDINFSPFKYVMALFYMVTPLLFLTGLCGIAKSINNITKKSHIKEIFENKNLPHILLIGTILTYIVFFTPNSRSTERWMLPIIPLILIYSSKGFFDILYKLKSSKYLVAVFVLLMSASCLVYPYSLVKQLSMGKPRANAYLWFKEYIRNNDSKKVLMYTNKGSRDPFKAIENIELKGFNVYESKNAQTFLPKNPMDYDIIITYSEMKRNYDNRYIINKYPEYYKSWRDFFLTLNNESEFETLKDFPTTKMNLMRVPEISIYQKK